MVGLPVAGISTMFYVALILGMGATKLWRLGMRLIRSIGNKVTTKLASRL